MNLEFVPPDLRRLDRVHAAAMALHLFENDVPLPDLVARIDWRLCGALSRLVLSGRLSGRAGETVLMPTQGRFGFERLILLGLGPRRPLAREEVGAEIGRTFDVLSRMHAHSAALALPGRPQHETDPSVAIDMLLQIAADRTEVDELLIVEDPKSQKVMNAYLDVGHRRIK